MSSKPTQQRLPQPPQFSNLLHLKLDFSLIQDSLTQTIKDLYSRMSSIESSTSQLARTQQKSEKQIHKIYELIETSNESNKCSIKQLEERMNSIKNGIVQKTPQEMLDHIQNRLQVNLKNDGKKDLDVNVSPLPSDRIVQTFRVKENGEEGGKNGQQGIDQKVYSIYEKTVQKIEEQITKLRKDFRCQISQISSKSRKIIQNLQNTLQHDLENSKKQRNALLGTLKNIEDKMKPNQSIPKSEKTYQISSKFIEPPKEYNYQPEAREGENEEESGCSPLQKIEIKQFLEQVKKEVKAELEEVVKGAGQRFEQINRTNSILADHIAQSKKQMQTLLNQKDSLKIQLSSMREKFSTCQRQIYLLVDTSNESKNRIKSIQNNITKLNEELKQLKQLNNEIIKQQANQDDIHTNSNNSSKKDILRDSHSSFRSSGINNLNPLRNNSLLKLSNNKIEGIEEMVKGVNVKVAGLIDRVNRIEDERKKWDMQQYNSSLPKIDKQNKSSINPLQLLKRQLKRLSQDISKTNQKLNQTKQNLQQLYQTHKDIPQKINQIHIKIRQKNQLQQDRLIELIKQLINRILIDPFDNNFTNRLKRQINVKFLEIKHQYHCILKEIESKVQNRAEIGELSKMGNKFQEAILEAKAICNKKCDTQDFKKGMKYLQNKIKEVFQFARSQTVALANQQKQYIGAKKQQLH